MLRALRVLVVVAFVLALLIAAAAVYLRTSLPRVRGRVELPGLGAPVEVLRDRHAIPHIYAETDEDAIFALGFVHAQDRLWQLEFQRRLGSGRLAEVLGEDALGTDRFLRTLGVRRAAETSLEAMSPRTRGLLQAYAAGINAYLDTRRGPLPPEFLLLRFEPEPFTEIDVVVWQKMMAWDLSGNWDDEVLRARLANRVSRSQLEQLWPPYPDDAPVVLDDAGLDLALFRSLDPVLAGLWRDAVHPLPPGAGSNNWVLAGEHTLSGAPLLANDPHLGLGAPSTWYFAHLSAPGLEVIGATLPGTPAVLLGRTDRLAWGFTNTGPDVQDLFLERVDPDDPNRYLTPEGSEPFVVHDEEIRVRGGEPVALRVRETRHGPVISDVSANARQAAGGGELVLALRWTALDPDDLTLQAALRLNFAQDWESFRDALRDFHVAMQSIVYADVEGRIAFIAPGRVPIRAAGDGRLPVPGWSGAYDWQGYIPFDELPQAVDPPAGRVVTANHKLVPDSYPYFLTHDWSEPYRADRILELLERLERHTPESFAAIQADQWSGMAASFVPLLRAVEPATPQAERALAMLLDWDGEMDAERTEPLLFWAWYRSFGRQVYGDELGDLTDAYYGFRPLFLRSVLDEHRDWCDDVRTPASEACELLAARALREGLAELNERFGPDMASWRWGDAHRALFDHPVMTNTPLRPLFDLRVRNGGDPFTVDAARFAIGSDDDPFVQTAGPGFRAVYDLADLDRSRFIHGTGQSGNPLSLRYRDYLRRWRDVRYLPMQTDRDALRAGAMGTLRLVPR